MGCRYKGWEEWAEGTKGSLECALLSHVRFNRADVNGWTQCWVYKNSLPEVGPFKGAPEPEPIRLTPHVSSWEKSKAVERQSVCWFHHSTLLCVHANSFPTRISSTVLMAASNNTICHNNVVSTHSKHAQIFRYLSCSTFSHPLCCPPFCEGNGIIIT